MCVGISILPSLIFFLECDVFCGDVIGIGGGARARVGVGIRFDKWAGCGERYSKL